VRQLGAEAPSPPSPLKSEVLERQEDTEVKQETKFTLHFKNK